MPFISSFDRLKIINNDARIILYISITQNQCIIHSQ